MTTYREPIRFKMARLFIESAKDTGDAAAVAMARRVWWQINSPRERHASDADMAAFHEFCQ